MPNEDIRLKTVKVLQAKFSVHAGMGGSSRTQRDECHHPPPRIIIETVIYKTGVLLFRMFQMAAPGVGTLTPFVLPRSELSPPK